MINSPKLRKRLVQERIRAGGTGKLSFQAIHIRREICPECGKMGTHILATGVFKHKTRNTFGTFKETTYCQIKKTA